MKSFIQGPLTDTPDNLMKKGGYDRHCVELGRACFHRKLNDTPFPRFHAYVSVRDNGMEIDLHLDQKNINRKGNHDQDWAYHGGRVEEEMKRLNGVIKGQNTIGHVNAPTYILDNEPQEAPKKRSFFQILFK
jgi:hypothetical protein